MTSQENGFGSSACVQFEVSLGGVAALQVAGAGRVQVEAPNTGPGRFSVAGMFGLGLSLGFPPFAASLAGQMDLTLSVKIPEGRVKGLAKCAINPAACAIDRMKIVLRKFVSSLPGFKWMKKFAAATGIVDTAATNSSQSVLI